MVQSTDQRSSYYDDDSTVVHKAVRGGLFRLVIDVFIDQYGFDVDFYKPQSKLTLLHVVAKYYSNCFWCDYQKEGI